MDYSTIFKGSGKGKGKDKYRDKDKKRRGKQEELHDVRQSVLTHLLMGNPAQAEEPSEKE